MICRDIESLILAERDGALSKPQLAELSDHVATCPACRKLRTSLTTALETYRDAVFAVTPPDPNQAWRDLQVRLHEPAKRRPLAPVLWFTAPLAAAAALAFAFFVSPPPAATPAVDPGVQMVAARPPPPPPPLHDPSFIAGADFVEAGDPNASTIVYLDNESGWLVVWATNPDAGTSG